MNWVHLTTAPDEWTAHIWRGILMEEGVPVIFRGGDTPPFLGNSPFPCRLMVDEALKQKALEILKDQLERDEL